MIATWYALVGFMLIIYVALDGRNFGAGMLHWLVASTPQERRQVIAAIGPLYVIALKTHLLDSLWLLIILYAAMNLPLAIWMIRSFMLEVPTEMLEAARLDGAGRFREITEVIMPVVSPGLVSTALICVIFAWNELFLALNLTVTNASTMPMFLISSVPQEGLYIAHLSAAATVASVPVIIVGWIAQRSLVRGLSMGAIK